ncbi:MAG: glucodextranase DOMON-like domain-containing protein [Anaeromyxobacteraceae bacterium]
MRSAALLALLLAGPAPSTGPGQDTAGPRLVVSFDDPAGDAYGPGSYEPPGDPQFQDGDFDLRRFAVLVDGDDVILEVTLGAPIRRPDAPQRTNSTSIDLLNGIYLQNVDVYVDTDRTRPGASACVPGRRVAFAGNRTWEHAVVLTPQPGPARAVIQEALGPDSARVVVPDGVLTRGRTLVVRLPAAALGGTPERSWGWSVQVSGARWERSFGALDRFRDARELDAFTMPVNGVREAYAFGGAPSGQAYPRVIDVLLPPGVDQRKVLGAHDARTGAFARVPFVYGDGADPFLPEGGVAPASAPTPAVASVASAAANAAPLPEALAPRALPRPDAARPAAAGAWTVADVSGDLVTIAGPAAGLAALRIGRVLGPDGATVARVVVGRVVEGGITASVVEGRDRIVRGAAVRFDAP